MTPTRSLTFFSFLLLSIFTESLLLLLFLRASLIAATLLFLITLRNLLESVLLGCSGRSHGSATRRHLGHHLPTAVASELCLCRVCAHRRPGWGAGDLPPFSCSYLLLPSATGMVPLTMTSPCCQGFYDSFLLEILSTFPHRGINAFSNRVGGLHVSRSRRAPESLGIVVEWHYLSSCVWSMPASFVGLVIMVCGIGFFFFGVCEGMGWVLEEEQADGA